MCLNKRTQDITLGQMRHTEGQNKHNVSGNGGDEKHRRTFRIYIHKNLVSDENLGSRKKKTEHGSYDLDLNFWVNHGTLE